MDYIVTNGKLLYFYNQNTVFLEKLVVIDVMTELSCKS